MKLMELLIIAA